MGTPEGLFGPLFGPLYCPLLGLPLWTASLVHLLVCRAGPACAFRVVRAVTADGGGQL